MINDFERDLRGAFGWIVVSFVVAVVATISGVIFLICSVF